MERKAIETIRGFNRFYTNLLGLLDKRMYDSQFSLAQARVLYELNHSENATARTIMNQLNLDEGYLSRIIDGFIRAGLAKKSRSEEDGRVYHINVTPKGRGQFQRIDSASRLGIGEMISHLNAKEVDELLTLMDRITQLLSRNEQQKTE
jgi:DNA-binding MarR family transcriptional regulator